MMTESANKKKLVPKLCAWALGSVLVVTLIAGVTRATGFFSEGTVTPVQAETVSRAITGIDKAVALLFGSGKNFTVYNFSLPGFGNAAVYSYDPAENPAVFNTFVEHGWESTDREAVGSLTPDSDKNLRRLNNPWQGSFIMSYSTGYPLIEIPLNDMPRTVCVEILRQYANRITPHLARIKAASGRDIFEFPFEVRSDDCPAGMPDTTQRRSAGQAAYGINLTFKISHE